MSRQQQQQLSQSSTESREERKRGERGEKERECSVYPTNKFRTRGEMANKTDQHNAKIKQPVLLTLSKTTPLSSSLPLSPTLSLT